MREGKLKVNERKLETGFTEKKLREMLLEIK